MKSLRRLIGICIGMMSLMVLVIASIFMIVASSIASVAHWIAVD